MHYTVAAMSYQVFCATIASFPFQCPTVFHCNMEISILKTLAMGHIYIDVVVKIKTALFT